MNINKNLSDKPLYNLEYWIGNKHESTILYTKTTSQCRSFGNMLKKSDSRYKLGKFKQKLN